MRPSEARHIPDRDTPRVLSRRSKWGKVPPTELPSRASVVIIGGGIMGLSTAYHLARSGVTDIVLLEKGEFGSGSTCKAAGGVRAQFSDAVNIELGWRSLKTFETFDFGGD